LRPPFSRELARASEARFAFEATAGKPALAKAAASCRTPKRLRRRRFQGSEESRRLKDRATAEILRRPDQIGTPQDDSSEGFFRCQHRDKRELKSSG
jgi:hypothetical protein